MKNIVLIGMAGSGKSTLGVLLAKSLGMPFVDTDLMIQQNEKKLLQEIIDTYGISRFLDIEEKVMLSIESIDSVIATGGSVVYSLQAMEHLKKHGRMVYLKLSYEEIEKRIQNITTRGIVMEEGKTLKDIFDERVVLYEKYADIIIDCNDKDTELCLQNMIIKLIPM
ncbi:MAG: shikimate kinase [Clostridia bacterium]|nr:shikimate kinase [Clostridia bacterium]